MQVTKKTSRINWLLLARVVSIVGHPFVLLPLTILIASLQHASPLRVVQIVGVTVMVTIVPLWLIIRRNVRNGKWSDTDVSVHAERGGFYPVLIVVTALASLVFYLANFPRSLVAGMLISLGLLLAAMLINRYSKVSLHLIFAAYCAVSLLAVGIWTSLIFTALTIAVGCSRVVLKRHTIAQVLTGAALGTTAGVILLKLLNFI